jgi:demethylmenaquinone methyltransferase/2-methoxy-6-polyprenyl-1,4-benzoquinol methylase
MQQQIIRKKNQIIEVQNIFNSIGLWYDLVSFICTLGMIKYWRRTTSELLFNRGPLRVLDLGCGTAEQIISFFSANVPLTSVTGIDISEKMLQVAQKKVARYVHQSPVFLLQGDMHSLKFENSFFDAVTLSFGLCFSPDTEQLFSEAARVLKQDCPLIITEFNKPKTFATFNPYTFYINFVIPGTGRLISGARESYKKIATLINELPDQDVLFSQLKSAGFQKITKYQLFPGFVTQYSAKKRSI